MRQHRWVSVFSFGFRSTSANSNHNHYPGVEPRRCGNEWHASRASLRPGWPGFTYSAFESEREMTHQTLVTASWLAPSRLLWTPLQKNSSDGPMIYLTRADAFCIKRALMLQRTWWQKKRLLQQGSGCVILSEHFLNCGRLSCRFEAGRTCFGKMLEKKTNFLCPDGRDVRHLKPMKRSIQQTTPEFSRAQNKQQSSAHF